MTSRNLLRWGGVAVGALAAITVIASTAMPRNPDVPPRITVQLTDAGTSRTTDCTATAYEGSFFDGATVTVDADEAVLGEATVGGAGTSSDRGCTWTAVFEDVEIADEYTITLRSAGSPPREHVYSYSAEDLAERDGALSISVFA
ncbi:hypothetical protein [Georgenia subflava]|uniref:Uncharacterized protein n=1 Tax=Georgenia subflava TaxID=1622177 RepID=A0A6N7EMV3_9MICO|nr:hypothetical protein [Georgenia subflava]MPV37476.1 hypothetical protein [Georgenia subflava]